MDHVSTFAVSTSDAVSEVHCRGTERACRCGATEGFARDRRPVGAADQDEGPCRSGGSGSPARVGQVVATPGLHGGTGRAKAHQSKVYGRLVEIRMSGLAARLMYVRINSERLLSALPAR